MPDDRVPGYSSLTNRLDGVGPDQWAVHHEASRRSAAGEPIIMLSIGEPDTPTPPEIVDKAVEALRAGRTRYSTAEGETNMLDAIAAKYSQRTGREIVPDQTIFTPGAHTALSLVSQALLERGDDVLLPEPFYAAYSPVLALTGAKIVEVPLRPEDEFHLTEGALEASLTPNSKALILNNPHNPTGAVLSADRVGAVAGFCRDHDLWLISDEVYEHLIYDGEFASPFDLTEMADRVAVVSSLSKSHSMTGWRCGWGVMPLELSAKVRRISTALMFGGQPFLQDAAAFALTSGLDAADAMRDVYRQRAGIVASLLEKHPSIRVHRPKAGIFVMIDIRPTGLTGTEFAIRLLDEKSVATMPGESFGTSAAGHIRISLTVPDDVLREGCERLTELATSG